MRLSPWFRLLRPHQWTKNLLVVVPALAAHQTLSVGLVLTLVYAVGFISLMASAFYILNDLMDLAIQEKDHAAQIMLQWFVSEQVEEEEAVQKVLDVLEKIGDSGHGLIMLDRELGARPLPVTLPVGGE